MNITIAELFLKELEAEETATRKCLERIPERLFDWKPHDKSMQLGYLTLLVADIPKWISTIIEIGEINFATWEKYTPSTTADVLKRFDENIEHAKRVLKGASNDMFDGEFVLKAGDQELMRSPKVDSVSSSINHWVHHRGQLTVYMRLNDIPVPSIYGPSADEKTF